MTNNLFPFFLITFSILNFFSSLLEVFFIKTSYNFFLELLIIYVQGTVFFIFFTTNIYSLQLGVYHLEKILSYFEILT